MIDKRISKLTSSYLAAYADGTVVTVNVFTEFIAEATTDGSEEKWRPGSEAHRLEMGTPVSVASDGVLFDVRGGRALLRR